MEKTVIYYAGYTPEAERAAGVGPVSVAITLGSVVELSLSGPVERFAKGLKNTHGPEARLVEDPAQLVEVFDAIERYLSGQPEGFDDITVAPAGTPFQRRVWDALMRVPWGEVVTYGELAEMAGRPGAARAVGGACGANPIPLVIPCHRVVGAGGRIGGYSGGVGIKQALLEIEGHGVSNSGVIEPASTVR